MYLVGVTAVIGPGIQEFASAFEGISAPVGALYACSESMRKCRLSDFWCEFGFVPNPVPKELRNPWIVKGLRLGAA